MIVVPYAVSGAGFCMTSDGGACTLAAAATTDQAGNADGAFVLSFGSPRAHLVMAVKTGVVEATALGEQGRTNTGECSDPCHGWFLPPIGRKTGAEPAMSGCRFVRLVPGKWRDVAALHDRFVPAGRAYLRGACPGQARVRPYGKLQPTDASSLTAFGFVGVGAEPVFGRRDRVVRPSLAVDARCVRVSLIRFIGRTIAFYRTDVIFLVCDCAFFFV